MSTSNPPAAPRLPWKKGLSALKVPSTSHVEVVQPDGALHIGAFPEGWLPRDPADVDASWLRQVTLVKVPGGTIRLQARLEEPCHGGVAGDQFADRDQPAWPLRAPVIVIGAVRGATAIYPDEAQRLRDEVAVQLSDYGVGVLEASTVDREHRWAEPAIVAFPLTIPDTRPADWRVRTLERARRAGFGTVVEIVDGQWRVLSLGDLPSSSYSVIAVGTASVTRETQARCPMQCTPEAQEYCTMHGGPWTSSSMTAATGWKATRDLLIEAVGCDTCEGKRFLLGGKLHQSGGPIALAPSAMPTRWLAPDSANLVVGGDERNIG